LKLIVDLEKEILAFVPETYYEVDATFNQLKASHHHGKERLSKEKADHILNVAVNPFTVSTIDTKENTRKPKAPFTTSTLQQDAYRHLGYSATKTMMLAQMLYEGVKIDGESKGLITYMRSDSTRLSKDFYEPALSHIEANYGKQYVGAYKNTTSSSAQDAHEAIRPTSVSLTPDYVRANVVKSSFRNKNLFEPAMKLYERVYYRTLASLMTPAKLLKTTVTIESNQEPFRIEGIQVIFDGFNKVYDDVRTKDVILPNWKLGETLIADEIISIEKETKPAARFNEGSLIKTLDKLGIGRPSTYASIIKTLEDRQYVTKEENRFKPTEQGILTSDELDNFFKDIINVEYTAEMEDHLDKIAVGEYQRNDILSSFYQTFEPMLEHAKTNMQKVQPEMLDEMCPECGSPLVIRTSRYGKFKGCSNYPTCKYNDIKREKKEPKEVGRDCPKCGKPLVIRTGRKGKFIGCSGFPKCRHVEQLEEKVEDQKEETTQ
ncbi:MAG: DNA topoisomerase, partial [Acholeplasmataceae bacterium]